MAMKQNYIIMCVTIFLVTGCVNRIATKIDPNTRPSTEIDLIKLASEDMLHKYVNKRVLIRGRLRTFNKSVYGTISSHKGRITVEIRPGPGEIFRRNQEYDHGDHGRILEVVGILKFSKSLGVSKYIEKGLIPPQASPDYFYLDELESYSFLSRRW